MTNGERLAKMEQKLDDACTDITELKKNISDFIEYSDQKYSAKWVEKTYIGFLITITTALFGIFIYLLEKHII